MKCSAHRWFVVQVLSSILVLLVGCAPLANRETNKRLSESSSLISYPSYPGPVTHALTPIASPTVSETTLLTRTSTPTTAPTVSIAASPTRTSESASSPIISYPGPPTQTFTPTASPTPTETPGPTATPQHQCPVPTQEILWVKPVTSPTNELSQIIVVGIGYGEYVTVISESGTFTVTANSHSFQVEIALLPNTVHHLEVIAKVRNVTNLDGCIYGGYIMTTTFDGQGNPLTIVQGEPNSYP